MTTMITLEQLNNALDTRFDKQNALFDRKLDHLSISLEEKLDKKFTEQYEELAGMMARGLTELGDELRAEFKEGIAAATAKW